MLVPITADHAALAFNQWCTIHASLESPSEVARAQTEQMTAVRTVCGSDVFPYIVAAGSDPANARPMLMSWPPPPGLRCVDCERILGRPRPVRGGWGTWDTLKAVAA